MKLEHDVRLLLALDNADPNESALRSVSALLDAERLEVTALYVEDEDLLRAAALPGLREISLTGQQSTLDVERLSRDLAHQAALSRQTFEALAQRLARDHAHLRHRFLVAQGRIAEEFGRAAAEADFVMVTRGLRSAGLRTRLGQSFAGLARQRKHMLFVNEPWSSGSSVVVLDGDSAAVSYAARLAHAEGVRLVVATAPTEPGVRRLPAAGDRRPLEDWSEDSIARLCLREDARVLVLPDVEQIDCDELLVSLLDKLPCSLLKLAR